MQSYKIAETSSSLQLTLVAESTTRAKQQLDDGTREEHRKFKFTK